MKKLLLILFLLPQILFAQEGMKFVHGKTWNEILKQAAKEKKYIMIDAYTTWCGPCKYMSKTIFPMPEAGKFYNANFINVKVQMDKTDDDNEEIKSWYATAAEMEKKYNVMVYPTYLFLNSKGELVHRAVGSSDVNGFIEKGKSALDPEKQFYTLQKKYQAGNRETKFLKNLAYAASDVYEMKFAAEVADAYLETQKDYWSKETLEFIVRFSQESSSKGFQFLIKNYEKADHILGDYKASKTIVGIITQEEVFKKIKRGSFPSEEEWKKMEENINEKYPEFASESILKAKTSVYKAAKEWENYFSASMQYIEKYEAKISANDLNSFAWTFFEQNENAEQLNIALRWSKKSFADKENPSFMDTYANLLYKLGRVDEAVAMETKAMGLLTNDEDKTAYQETIEKMKKGEKTW